MGRLTEAFGFCIVEPEKFAPLWVKHHITTLEPKPNLYTIRRQFLSEKRKRNKNEKN